MADAAAAGSVARHDENEIPVQVLLVEFLLHFPLDFMLKSVE